MSVAGRKRSSRRSCVPDPRSKASWSISPGRWPMQARSCRRLAWMNGFRTVGQSFFDPLPAGADLYLLKSILTDWPDREAQLILSRCAEAARPSGRIVILGGVSPDDRADPQLLMMVLLGSKDRTLTEFGALAKKALLQVQAAGRLPSGRFAVECRPM